MHLPPAFLPLRHDRFRNLAAAGLVSFLGTWVHNVAARWTATELAESPAVVSLIDTLQLAPMVVLTLGAGRLADTVDRRRLIASVQLGMAGTAALLGVLAFHERLSLPWLLGLTALMGVLGSLIGPAWQATVPRQVPDEEVPAAVALMSTGFNLARAVGPAMGAAALTRFGPAWAFWVNALSYSLIAWLIWRLPAQPPSPRAQAADHPLADPVLKRLFATVFAFGLVAMPSLSLLPVVARDALHGGPETYGHLLSAFGAGAVATGVFVAWAARRLGNREFVELMCGLSALGLLLLGRANTEGVAVLGAALCGAGWIGTISTINAAVQVRSRPASRGRALAWYLTFAVAGQAMGSLLAGQIAAHWGTPATLKGCSAALLGLIVVVYFLPRSAPAGAPPSTPSGGDGGRA